MGKHFNKTLKEYTHKLTTTGFDPITGTLESDVTYLPNFGGVLDNLIKVRKDLSEIVAENKDDQKLRKIYHETRLLLNKYRTHIRKNYPHEYEELTKINEEEGSMNTGVGEQYATPKAFKKKRK